MREPIPTNNWNFSVVQPAIACAFQKKKILSSQLEMHRKAPIVMAREKLTHKSPPIWGKNVEQLPQTKTKQTKQNKKTNKMVSKNIPSESKTRFCLWNEARKKTQLKRPCPHANKKTMKTHVKNERGRNAFHGLATYLPTTAIAHKAFLFEQKKRTKEKKRSSGERKHCQKIRFCATSLQQPQTSKKSPSYKQQQTQKKKTRYKCTRKHTLSTLPIA